jgi:hypothetical protein
MAAELDHLIGISPGAKVRSSTLVNAKIVQRALSDLSWDAE